MASACSWCLPDNFIRKRLSVELYMGLVSLRTLDVAIAKTGSGKTVAFGVPLCHHVLSLPRKVLDTVPDEGPLALVMAPTRELALQINIEFGKLLSKQDHVKCLAVVGGQSITEQATKLRNGIHVVVGTPGRINDCVEMAYLVLNQCSYIVLDEADRMIDLGFAPQIEQSEKFAMLCNMRRLG